MTHLYSLPHLGWQVFYQQQLTLEEWENFTIARVAILERSLIHVLTVEGGQSLRLTPGMPILTVGDWILIDRLGQFHRVLDRLSLFSSKAAGTK